MSIGAHILRALFLLVGIGVGIGAFALLATDVHPGTTNNSTYSCGSTLDPTSVDPEKLCDNTLQTRAQTAQALAVVALGAFVAAAAVSIGGRHRITIQDGARGPHLAAPPASYAPPGYPPPGGTAPPRA